MSSFSDFIKEIEKSIFWLVFLDFLFLLSPGILFLVYLYPELFLAIDNIKLILLALTIGGIPAAAQGILFLSRIVREDRLFRSFSIGIIISGLAFYFSLFIIFSLSATFSVNFKIKEVINIIIFTEILVNIIFRNMVGKKEKIGEKIGSNLFSK